MIRLVTIALLAASGWKGYSADVALPVPDGWKFDGSVSQPHPTVPAKGRECANWIWFDFVPGASLDYAKKLIATESVEVTAAIRRWDDQTYREVELAKRRAAAMRNGDDRTVYVLAFDAGALIIQALGFSTEGKGAACVPLHDEVAAKLVELFFAPDVQKKVKALPKALPKLKELPAVPATLDEALTLLEKQLDAADLAEIRASKNEDFMHGLHHGFGTGLRNGWGLWGGSPLAKSFNAMGIRHPDDMSGIILTSFWRKQHGQPIELEKQVAYYRRYWDVRRPPETSPCGDGGAPKSLLSLAAGERIIQIYTCGKSYHAYELDAGWYAPGEKMKKRVEALRREGNVVSAPLEEGGGGGTTTELKR